MNTLKRRLAMVAVLVGALTGAAPALDQVDLGMGSGQEGMTAVVPLTLSGTGGGAISLVTATIASDPVLGVPTVAPGAGQPNMLAGDAFVDAVSPGVYRVTCFVRDAPNMPASAGAVVDLTYSLAGVPANVYPLTLTTSELFDVSNADVARPGTNGQITVLEVPQVPSSLLVVH